MCMSVFMYVRSVWCIRVCVVHTCVSVNVCIVCTCVTTSLNTIVAKTLGSI